MVLADDFKCIESGPISDIHIWASFADDILPGAGVDSLGFTLSIHADIPDPNPADPSDWSMPEVDPLWTEDFLPGQYTVRPVAAESDQIWEDWYDPSEFGQVWLDNNHLLAFQYNFYPVDPFIQEYGNTYWLDVKVVSTDGDDFTFGWKTTKARDPDLRWNDDAVYWDLTNPALGWQPLKYPEGHEYYPETLDLAFVITPEPATLGLLLVGGFAMLGRRLA